uniref:Uncharacterized protein n=1 Tax=viral metagenome TaxID=1070528 RepID=A0A6C0BE82_9ZZZZ
MNSIKSDILSGNEIKNRMPDYDNMTIDEVNACKIKFRVKFNELSKLYAEWSINHPLFEEESLPQIHLKYEEIIDTILKYNEMKSRKAVEEDFKALNKKTNSFFNDNQITFDYTKGFLKQVPLHHILSINSGLIGTNTFINSLKEKFNSKEEPYEDKQLMLGVILWLKISVMFPSSFLLKDFLERKLLVLEEEHINVSSVISKVINSEIFNDEYGKPYSSKQESNNVIKIITKITINDIGVISILLSDFRKSDFAPIFTELAL